VLSLQVAKLIEISDTQGTHLRLLPLARVRGSLTVAGVVQMCTTRSRCRPRATARPRARSLYSPARR
jgi:hypothetical protein